MSFLYGGGARAKGSSLIGHRDKIRSLTQVNTDPMHSSTYTFHDFLVDCVCLKKILIVADLNFCGSKIMYEKYDIYPLFVFQVDISLNLDQLKEEIDFLKNTQRMKKTMSALSCRPDAIISKKRDERYSGPFEQYSESVKLLMDWVNAVCGFYNKKVSSVFLF